MRAIAQLVFGCRTDDKTASAEYLMRHGPNNKTQTPSLKFSKDDCAFFLISKNELSPARNLLTLHPYESNAAKR